MYWRGNETAVDERESIYACRWASGIWLTACLPISLPCQLEVMPTVNPVLCWKCRQGPASFLSYPSLSLSVMARGGGFESPMRLFYCAIHQTGWQVAARADQLESVAYEAISLTVKLLSFRLRKGDIYHAYISPEQVPKPHATQPFLFTIYNNLCR